VQDAAGVPIEEIMRVLSPRGVAYVTTGDRWTKTAKPRPDDIDQWAHFLHDATGNAVSNDTLFAAGPLGEPHLSLAAFKGKEGIRLLAMSTADGQRFSELKINSLPVHDGLAAARGKLYLATKDGRVTCFSGP
jgi:hypothetical protein